MAARVFHLATPAEWAAAQARSSVEPDSLASEGFVHCSTTAQLAATIERHFPGVAELALLQIDVERMGESVVWEEGRPGEVFPHVYRAIELSEVLDVVVWRQGQTDLPA